MKAKALWIDGIEQEFEILHDNTGIKQYYIRDNTIDFIGKKICLSPLIPDDEEEREITIPLFNVRWIEVFKDA